MDELRKNACAEGGDTIYDIDEGKQGEAHIMIATIAIRDVSAPPEVSPAPTAASAPAPAPQTAGCMYDTQCKGDRICVEGQCNEPAAPREIAPAGEEADQTAEPTTSDSASHER